MNEELKPCPFCGKDNPNVGTEAEFELDDALPYSSYYAVCCSYNEGGCGGTSGYRPSRESAIKAWNTRKEENK